MEETRWRKGKLERKDPRTGVWVIHPAQYFHDHRDAIVTMFEEQDKEMRAEERRLKRPDQAQEFLDNMRKDDPELPHINVGEVFLSNVSETLRDSSAEIVFRGKDRKKYVAGCWSSSGSWDEPPDYACWIEPLHEVVGRLERSKERGFINASEKAKLEKLKKLQ
jgi:hypothetical protein